MTDSKVTSLSQGYRDLNLAFKTHPLYGDIRPLKDIEAIKASIRKIVMTRRGEIPFNPDFGCDIEGYLFEPMDAITSDNIGREIKYSINQHEPRVEILEIFVTGDESKNLYNVRITVKIVNKQENVDVDLQLERLR